MSLVDNLKKKVHSVLRLEPPTVSICMMGPRAVGKTTVVTSIFSKSQETVGDSRIFMSTANNNAAELPNYRTKLEYAFEKNDPASLPATDIPADFLFDLGILGSAPTVQLAIQDYPGEYLTTSDPDKKAKLDEFVLQSHIILVAVDTPYLMEEDGAYNNEKNLPEIVMDYLTKHPDQVGNKLVMVIPLKCERYFYEKRMEEVAQRIIETYRLSEGGHMLEFFVKHNIASVIAPILSLGGMEFDRMVDNNTGKGVLKKIPEFRMYKDNPTYNPLFCAQPFYYLLAYVSKFYKWQQDQTGGLVKRIRNSLNSYLVSDTAFLSEISKMHTRIETKRFGYKVIVNNSIINF